MATLESTIGRPIGYFVVEVGKGGKVGEAVNLEAPIGRPRGSRIEPGNTPVRGFLHGLGHRPRFVVYSPLVRDYINTYLCSVASNQK